MRESIIRKEREKKSEMKRIEFYFNLFNKSMKSSVCVVVCTGKNPKSTKIVASLFDLI